MPRPAKIWWREERQAWFTKINGKKINLGGDKKAAQDEFWKLKSKPEAIAATGTVWEVMDRFLEWLDKSNRAKGTYEWYKTRLQYFKDGVANMPASKLRPFHVQAWLDGKKWSSGHKRGVVTAIKRAFSWAAKSGVMSENTIAGLEKPEAGQRDRVLSSDEVKAIIKGVKDESFRDLLTVVAETGCRPQEVVRVEGRHCTGNAWVFPREESKGKRRQRIVFLTAKAKKITQKWAKRYATGPIFRNLRGDAWEAHAIGCRFQRMKERIGFLPCLYMFRHAYAHHAITKAGVDPVTTAALLGHSNTTMIYQTYGHLLKNEQFMLQAAKKATS